tara:strand:- start:814 stop:1395 length:582 start_codon:yes stop_codon:yes gene_type:complete
MWALIEDDTVVRTFNHPESITINNIQHPLSIFTLWSEEELNTIGIYSITKNITSFDSKIQKQISSSRVFENNTVVESNVVVDRDLDEIKQSLNTDVSNTLSSYLSQSDWYYIRKLDKEIAIPSAIQTWRNELRANAASMETSISNAADVAAIKTLINEGTLSVWSSYEDVVAAEVAAKAQAAEEEEEVVVKED